MSSRTGTKHCPGCSSLDAPDPAQQLVKTADDTMATLAEAVRVQSHAILALIERGSPKPEQPVIALPSPKTNTRGRTVISERVGSISVEQWDDMNNDQLIELDCVLKNLVDTTLLSGKSWGELAMFVRRDLAGVGFAFKSEDECGSADTPMDWQLVGNKSLPYLARMRSVASASKPTGDGAQWWADEMMRVVVRLMELRGI
ncbi:hypothetical protein Q9L58_005647 [Maublancomyces gigas]|uniref:Uncharacterized protein n=1 Tax=Discina gigas TaxID=1032678 RepID=A0ABR3GHM4_9PEZI